MPRDASRPGNSRELPTMTKEQLKAELLAMSQRIASLEESEAAHRVTEKALKERVEHYRRYAEELLDENSRFLQSLIDSIPTPIFYKDMGGRYLHCNKAFAAAVGRATDEIIGLTVFDLHPEDLARKYHEMDLRLFTRLGRSDI